MQPSLTKKSIPYSSAESLFVYSDLCCNTPRHHGIWASWCLDTLAPWKKRSNALAQNHAYSVSLLHINCKCTLFCFFLYYYKRCLRWLLPRLVFKHWRAGSTYSHISTIHDLNLSCFSWHCVNCDFIMSSTRHRMLSSHTGRHKILKAIHSGSMMARCHLERGYVALHVCCENVTGEYNGHIGKYRDKENSCTRPV